MKYLSEFRAESTACRAGEVLQGSIKPYQCPAFNNQMLAELGDSAVFDVDEGRLAFSTDSYVVCIAFSAPGPDVIRPESINKMASDAIVFACANPVPEIWP